MEGGENSRWLDWARQIEALGQTGLHFCTNDFDRQRYGRMLELASEMFAEHTTVSPGRYQEIFLAERGYATPKVDVRGAVFREGRILLVQEIQDGCWSLPGGWADINEKPSGMVEREVLEESGFSVKARKLVGVYEANHDRDPLAVFHAYKIVFLCDLISGEATPSCETSAVGFFDLDALPPFSAFRTRLEYIEEAFAHLADPVRPAAFD